MLLPTHGDDKLVRHCLQTSLLIGCRGAMPSEKFPNFIRAAPECSKNKIKQIFYMHYIKIQTLQTLFHCLNLILSNSRWNLNAPRWGNVLQYCTTVIIVIPTLFIYILDRGTSLCGIHIYKHKYIGDIKKRQHWACADCAVTSEATSAFCWLCN